MKTRRIIQALLSLLVLMLAFGGQPATLAAEPAAPPQPPKIYMAYFYLPGCPACLRVEKLLEPLQQKYPQLEIASLNLRTNAELNELLCEFYSVPQDARLVTPIIFVGRDWRVGKDIDEASLEALVAKYSKGGSPLPWEIAGWVQKGQTGKAEATESITERFRSFGILTVLGAGLIDGLNPCAFATIIFFTSYLAFAGRKGREVLLVGLTFAAAVFLAYLLIGLGVLAFLRTLTGFTLAARVLYLVAAASCLALAGLSLYDYRQLRRQRPEKMRLRLPRRLQRRVHQRIRESSTMRGYFVASFVTGFTVSVLEFACTGQVYLPTITFVLGVPELRANALLYLVLYNVVFILPLLVVLLLNYFGTTSRQLSGFLGAHAGSMKLLTSALFLLLAAWLIYAAF